MGGLIMTDLNQIFSKYKITETEAQQQIAKDLMKFQNVALGLSCDQITFNPQINQYYQNIYKLKTILQAECFRLPKSIFDKFDEFIAICKNPEFHIALVGAIKAGKSTLINSLLGQNLASTSVIPETAVLTKFRKSATTNYIRLTFYTQQEWDELLKSVQEAKAEIFIDTYIQLGADIEKANWIDHKPITYNFTSASDITKWTSSRTATHYFVKEVEVGLINTNIPEGIVYVDTPGLDDPVTYRSNITKKYIARANAVLVCVRSDSLTGGELGTIYGVFSHTNPEKVYVIGTQLDTLNRPNVDWAMQRESWLDIISRNDCYGSRSLADNHLIAVAAYIYNLVIHYDTLHEDDLWDLETIARKFRIKEFEHHLDQLKDISNVPILLHRLNDEILIKHRQLLVSDIENRYIHLKNNVIALLSDIKNSQAQILEASNQQIDDIKQKLQQSHSELVRYNQEQQNLEQAMSQIIQLTHQRAQELSQTIRQLGGAK